MNLGSQIENRLIGQNYQNIVGGFAAIPYIFADLVTILEWP